jgi:hypothetical protein
MTCLGPVILIVEGEFLLRVDSAETIKSASFEVMQAANADEAIAILKRVQISCCLHRYPDAGIDGRAEAGLVRSGPLAADQDCRDFRPGDHRRRRSAGRQRLPAEAVSRQRGGRGTARDDQRGLITAVPTQSPLKFSRPS